MRTVGMPASKQFVQQPLVKFLEGGDEHPLHPATDELGDNALVLPGGAVLGEAEHAVAPLRRGPVHPPTDLPEEQVGREVKDVPQHPAAAVFQQLGGGVGDIPQGLHRGLHLLPVLLGDVAVFVEHPPHRGQRDPGQLCHIVHGGVAHGGSSSLW